MYEMEQFIRAVVLLLALTGEAVFASTHPYLCILLAGLLMFAFAIRSLSDTPDRLLFAVQTMISIVFAVASGGYFTYLILSECRFPGNKQAHVFYPLIVYSISFIIMGNELLPQALSHLINLILVLGVLSLVQWLTMNYISVKTQISRVVRVTAVNEMYEKKLNKELVVKNYLADRNARLEERENISRNIHNSVGHSITAAIMALDAADMLFDTDPARAREKMNTANDRMRTSLEAIRRAVRVLDSESKYVSMGDFVNGLIAVIDSFVMDTFIKIRTDFPAMEEDALIPHEHAEFLTGAAQELLVNGVRHGGANMFLVMLNVDSGHIRLIVSDNGKSDFSEENQHGRIRNGFGLKKLIAYTEKCGGTAVFTNEGGFRSEIALPLKEYLSSDE